MKRIAIDMDEVIADAQFRFSEWYERDYGIKILKEQLRKQTIEDLINPEHRNAIKEYPRKEGFFKDLEVIEGSKEVIKELSKRFEIFITTAAMEFPFSFVHKLNWLNLHFPFISWKQIVFCGDKSIINADYLIDDNAYHFERFIGQGILFSAPHNMNINWPLRMNSWQEIKEFFDKIES
ncbi:MAG TPA: 5'(3')-deoxyribonucleotidase [Flavisolibacter sp.]|nr:5'(3')-deoxyribonucleotidase [Flavisolibacter sp.]